MGISRRMHQMFHANIIRVSIPVQAKDTPPCLAFNTEFLGTNIALFEIHMAILNANRIDLTVPIHGDIVLIAFLGGELRVRDSTVEGPVDAGGNSSLDDTVV